MITGAIKNKVDKIWTDIWAGGLTNPLTVIEQLTYLIFIRSLDEKETEMEQFAVVTQTEPTHIFPQSAIGQSMRWGQFKDKDPQVIFNTVQNYIFPAIKSMKGGKLPDIGEDGKIIENGEQGEGVNENVTAFSKYMKDAIFLIPTPQVLQKIVTGLEDLYVNDLEGRDMQGDLYEYMLGKLSTAGQNGQFRTPKHIREMMVRLADPNPKEIICDPACGTAGFLVSSSEYIQSKYGSTMSAEEWEDFAGKMFTGFDTDPTMLRLSAMNLMLHSITHPDIEYMDSVSKTNNIIGKFNVILANPPFKGTVDDSAIHSNLTDVAKTKKTELLFIALFIRMLRTSGRCACIVPDGVLFGSSKAHVEIRKTLVDKNALTAVISMPSGVFKPYAGVSTAVLVFTKTGTGGTDKVWFYDMESDGFSLDDKRADLGNNGDIDDIVERFHNLDKEESRDRTEKSFMVPADEIRDNKYDLSINKYKKIEYVPVEYPPTSEIIKDIEVLNDKIIEETNELKRLLGL